MYRGHLLFINYHHTKFEVPRPKHFLSIDRKPFDLQDQCDLDHRPIDSKRGHLLVMNNIHIKFKVSKPKRSLVIGRKPFAYGPTDRPTDKCKAIYPPPTSSKGA
jgi:hypothetical protein